MFFGLVIMVTIFLRGKIFSHTLDFEGRYRMRDYLHSISLHRKRGNGQRKIDTYTYTYIWMIHISNDHVKYNDPASCSITRNAISTLFLFSLSLSRPFSPLTLSSFWRASVRKRMTIQVIENDYLYTYEKDRIQSLDWIHRWYFPEFSVSFYRKSSLFVRKKK